MPISPYSNLVEMFFAQSRRLADKPFLWAKKDGAYRSLTWRNTAEQVDRMARGLLRQGIGRGDRVVIVSENRPEWLIADLAIMSLGAITTPAYTTNTPDDHRHVLVDSGAKAAIVSSTRLLNALRPATEAAADLAFVVAIDDGVAPEGLTKAFHRWDVLLEDGTSDLKSAAETARQWAADDIACIIYTSGTGGSPKGVMLHHGSLLHNCRGAMDALRPITGEDEVFLSFLPLSHSYEHTFGQFLPIAMGAQIYYADGVANVIANLAEARPSILVSVPRLYEMMRGRIMRDLQKADAEKAELFRLAQEEGRARYEHPESDAAADRDLETRIETQIRRPLQAIFGGRIKAMIAGGAPLNPDVGIFFHALGLRILQGYGQTESGPVISINPPEKPKMHTVGLPLADTEVRLAEDGELLVRGDLVMKGYWRDSAKTKETVIDGWLHTGDIAAIDGDGHVEIIDRKKDIIVNSGGDNIAPQRVEGIIALQPEIAQALVVGDRKPHLVALLVPDAAWLLEWATTRGKPADLASLNGDVELRAILLDVVGRVNATLSNIEKIRRFAIADAPFTIDNGQMTPSSKVRRHAVLAAYGDRLEALYR